MDQTHEPDQSTGRGTGNSGDYLQLSLFPTEEEQLGEIRKAAAALEQPAAFLISDEVVDDILRTGSGQKNTLFHITARLIEGLDNEEMQNFLKDEYGTGGKGFTIDGQKISIWYDNDGIRIRRGDSARRNFDRMVTWEEAADRIRDMYEDGNYVDNLISNNAIEQEQEEMTNLLALHFRDTSRNWEEQQSYSDWQDVVRGSLDRFKRKQMQLSIALNGCRKIWMRIQKIITGGRFSIIRNISSVFRIFRGSVPG